MAITLPDFTALPTVTPQAGGNLPQYPQNDPGAVALAELGKGTQAAGSTLVDIAAYRDIAQTKMDRASADADFTNATIPLTEQLKVETDPEKITEIRGKFRAALDAAAGNFTNPLARDYWVKGHASTVAHGQADADQRNTLLYRDSYQAGLLAKVNEVARTGAASDDPLGFGAGLVNIDSLTDAARQSGSITAVQAEQMRSKARADMVTGRVETLIARSRTEGQSKLDEASVLVDQYTNEIGALQAGHLRDRIAGRAETVGGQDLANRSRTGVGAAAGPSGGDTPETLQADFAKRSGAFGTPEEAGNNLTTVAAPGGATFRVHRLAAPQIQGFVNELEQNGYKIDPATSGGYNNRNKVGVNTSEKSEHAFGTAVDINWDRNKQAGTLITDLPANVGDIAAKWGLKWGGTFTGKKDAMHFEVARLGSAPAAQGAGPATGAQTPDRVDNWETQNNNFGGIRKQGADPNATTAEGGFEAYPTPEAGVQAIADNLRRYAAGGVVTEMNPDGKPLNTIRGIVSTWGPPSQNDTNALIGRASKVTGFKPDQTIDLKDPAVMAKVIEATIRNEQGGKLPVAPAIITKVAGGAPPSPAPAPPPKGQVEPGNIPLP